jgi:imidazolonepropionase-like amidohydrolase
LGSNENTALSLAKAIERGFVSGPRVIACGKTIIMTGGHDPFWGIQADGEVEVVKAVRKQVLAGAKVIKVSATGGVYGRIEGEEVGIAELTYQELKAICDEAHRFGLKVAAHVISEEGIWNCIKAGIDTIEHGHYMTEKAMNIMIEKNIFWVPTLFTYRKIAKGDGVPCYASEKARKIVDIHRKAFMMGLQKGVPFAAGSDAGSPAGVNHPSLLGELQSMVEYGCKPIVALKSATVYASQALGMQEHIGTLEVGKKADALIISHNPRENISYLSNVVTVIKNGEIVI